MDRGIIIFRNITGRVTPEKMLHWIQQVQLLGITVEEKNKGKAMILHLQHEEDDLVFYFYEQMGGYQLHIDYMRVRARSGQLLKAIESLIVSMGLRAEKYYTQRNELYRTLYVNGVIMDDGVFIERKIPPDWDLRIMREALMGHIYITLEEYTEAKKTGNEQRVQELHERLRAFVEEVAKVDQVLNSDRESFNA